MSAAVRAIEISEHAAEHFNDPSKAGKLWVPPASNALGLNNNVSFGGTIAEAFPDVDPEFEVAGSLMMVQIRSAKDRTAGGIILTTEDRRLEHDNTQIGRVHSYGPLAFKNRNTGEAWPEGAWCQPGDFIRIQKYQGDRFWKEYTRTENGQTVRDTVEFVILKDIAMLGRYTGDPLAVKAVL